MPVSLERLRAAHVDPGSSAYPAINAILYSSYANILLVFVPFSITTGALGWNSAVVFISNFLAIFPLAALLLYSTEELLKTPRDTFGGFINTTFGNAVEIIVSRLCIIS
jgi:Ca2+:H+ antiporter